MNSSNLSHGGVKATSPQPAERIAPAAIYVALKAFVRRFEGAYDASPFDYIPADRLANISRELSALLSTGSVGEDVQSVLRTLDALKNQFRDVRDYYAIRDLIDRLTAELAQEHRLRAPVGDVREEIRATLERKCEPMTLAFRDSVVDAILPIISRIRAQDAETIERLTRDLDAAHNQAYVETMLNDEVDRLRNVLAEKTRRLEEVGGWYNSCERIKGEWKARAEAAKARIVSLERDLEEAREALTVTVEALDQCAESLAFARDKLGMCGEGDGKDRKADNPDDIGSTPALLAAHAAISRARSLHKAKES